MPKRILAKAKKLFSSVLTLIVIGAFVVSPVMPLVAAAEEVTETPVVLETPVASEIPETVEEVVVEAPVEAEVTEPELSDSVTVEEVVEATTTPEVAIVADVAGVEEVVASSTDATPKLLVAEVAPSNILNSTSFAISGEFGGNGQGSGDSNGGGGNNNPNPVVINNAPIVVSGEFGGDTNQTNNNTTGQGTFSTLPSGNTGNSSGQGVFTTLPTGDQSSSGQGSFTTLAVNNNGSSGQGSFTTLSNGGGCTTNCGGGGGGGGGSHRRPPVTVPELPAACPVYLLKYIQLGADNDPIEVRKLEVFLNDFEGFSLPINGIYEPADFEAVKIFQSRYGADVLNPWGLEANDPTGYVYITTTYAINQIYCARTTANDFDFRTYGLGGVGVVDAAELPEATTTATTTAEATTTPNRLLLAAIGALDFIKDNWCWIFPIILLLIILILAIELWREKRKNDSLEQSLEEMASEGEPTLFDEEDNVDNNQTPLLG